MLQNVHRTEGDRAYVSLTLGQEAVIDARDLQKVLPYRWYASRVPKGFYARTTAPGGERLSMHRLIMEPREGEYVDHINHDTLDNRRANLRCVPPAVNSQNRWGHQENLSTGITNVIVLRRKDGYAYYSVVVTRFGKVKRRSFPLTPAGLEDAKQLAERWVIDIDYEPDRTPRPHRPKRVAPPIRTSTGIRGVSVQQYGKSGKCYAFRCFSKHCPAYKRFPLTPDGLESARTMAEAHHAQARANGYYA